MLNAGDKNERELIIDKYSLDERVTFLENEILMFQRAEKLSEEESKYLEEMEIEHQELSEEKLKLEMGGHVPAKCFTPGCPWVRRGGVWSEEEGVEFRVKTDALCPKCYEERVGRPYPGVNYENEETADSED